MAWIEPKTSRNPSLDYTICKLPEQVLAVVRTKYYKNGKADKIGEIVILQDGQSGYDTFAMAVNTALTDGADVSIRSQYKPEQLGIMQ